MTYMYTILAAIFAHVVHVTRIIYIWIRHTRMCIYLTHIIHYTDIQCMCNIAQTLRLSIVSRRLRVCSRRVAVYTYF